MKTVKIPPLSLTNFDDKQSNKTKNGIFYSKKKFLLSQIIILFFLLLIAFRVPYIGSFFDNLIDLFFGPIKYLFYLSIFCIWLLNIIKIIPFKKLMKKKNIIFYFMNLFFLCCLYTSIWALITKNDHDFKETLIHYSEKWISYFHANKYEFFFNNSAAGIIPLLLVLIIFLFLKIFTIVLLVVITTLMTLTLLNANYKKSKLWIKISNFLTKKIGMHLKIETIEEIKKNKTKFKFKKITKKKLKKSIENLTAPFFDLLPQNNIDNQVLNRNDASNIKNKIIGYLLQEKIAITNTQLQIFDNYMQLTFTCSNSKGIKKIVDNIKTIVELVKINHFNYEITNLSISLQFANKHPTKKSLASIASSLRHPKPFDVVCCYTLENKPFIKNLLESPNTLVIGKKLSGAVPFVILYCLSLCLTTSTKDLEISIFLDNPHLFNELSFTTPHIKNNIFSNFNEILINLKMTIENLKNRMNLFKQNNVTSLSAYNKIVNLEEKKLKTVFLVFNDLDLIIKNENADLIWQNLFYILENGKKCGINCLISAQTIFETPKMNKLLSLTDSKYIYALNNEYESIQLFNDNKCVQLFGSGDCYYFDKKTISQKQPLHLQTCYITKNELEYDLTLIKNFYLLKENNS